ncbi:MAG: PQQ-binding-like beta-propeller repeat protein [Terriglobia bacterium]
MGIILFLICSLTLIAGDKYSGWEGYGGGPENIHYSSLKQIHRDNVNQLKVAWTYDSNDAYEGSNIQCNPIVIKGVLYATTPTSKVIALDAATGKLIWLYDRMNGARGLFSANRGLMHWTDGKESRILLTLGSELVSLDARTGRLDPNFGENGVVDLRDAFRYIPRPVKVSSSSPGVIYRDLLILGSAVPEALPSTPGDIRAYNVRTGKLVWTFHTIPWPGEFGHDTWPPEAWKYSGGANDWAGMTVDLERGLLFVPTGSAAFDFYGADRHGDNLFANSLICLEAATGKRRWHYQAVKHDTWDLDFPTAPLLATLQRNGKPVDVVVQAGKDGFVYVFNRETGESLFPSEERSVPASEVEGELLSKTQRVPLKPAPFVRQEMTEATVTRRTEAAHKAALETLRGLKFGGRFTPESTQGTIVFPGFSGGAEWGGEAYDPETHLYYINANEVAWILRLVPAKGIKNKDQAGQIYLGLCASCHKPDRKGFPPEFPALDKLAGRLSEEQIVQFVASGSGRMPGFASLGTPALKALAVFLLKGEDQEVEIETGFKPPINLKYTFDGYNQFLDPDGYPAITPPWGSLSALDLNSGEYVWKIPLGEYPELVAQGFKDTGTTNHGGGIVTAGGLFFIGATQYDRKLRAFDKSTGKLLWETLLPFAGNATPATYEVNGRQYIVIAAGGGRGRPSGSQYIAFALP